MTVYTDLWPMWPVAETVTDCRKRTQINTTAMIATPWDTLVRPGVRADINPCQYRKQQDGYSDVKQVTQRFCIMYAVEPFYASPTPRTAQIEDRQFPTATDQER